MTLLQLNLRATLLFLLFFGFKSIFENKLAKRFLLFPWLIIVSTFLLPHLYPFASTFFSQHNPLFFLNFSQVIKPLIHQGKKLEVLMQNTTTDLSAHFELLKHLGGPFRYGFLSILFMLTTAGLLIFFFGRYFLLVRELRFSLPVVQENIVLWKKQHPLSVRKYQIRYYDQIQSPVTYGVFRPVILLPKRMLEYTDEEWFLILEHEYTHIKHFDSALSIILLAICCLNWFNPFVWLFFNSVKNDIEMICDESVLKSKSKQQRKQYAALLIQELEYSSFKATGELHFSRNSLKKRIKNILRLNQNKNRKYFFYLCGLLLLLLVTAMTYTADEQTFIIIRSSFASESDGDDENPAKSQSQLLTAEEFSKEQNLQPTTWWSYDEYEKYVQTETAVLNHLMAQNVAGFSKKEVNEAIANYEKVLKKIAQGYLLAKSFDNEQLMVDSLAYDKK